LIFETGFLSKYTYLKNSLGPHKTLTLLSLKLGGIIYIDNIKIPTIICPYKIKGHKIIQKNEI